MLSSPLMNEDPSAGVSEVVDVKIGIQSKQNNTQSNYNTFSSSSSSSSPSNHGARNVLVPDEDVKDPEEQYTWDMVMVFKVGNPTKMIHVRGEEPRSERDVFSEYIAQTVTALQKAQLKIKLYKGVEQNRIFCLIGATEARLAREAERLEYELLLDPVKCINLGAEHNIRLARFTVKPDPKVECPINHDKWTNLYGKFVRQEKKEEEWRHELYQRFEYPPYRPSSLFTAIDRLKLTFSIIEGPKVGGGASLRLAADAEDSGNPLYAYFPLHEYRHLSVLESRWSNWMGWWDQPLDKIRNYMGEKVAMYFAFLEIYNRSLFFVSFVGLALFIWQIVAKRVDVDGAVPFGIFMAIWSTLFLERWKRKCNELTTRWGMVNFEKKEQPRSGFKGDWAISPVDGKLVTVYSYFWKMVRLVFGQSVIWTLIGCVIGCVVGVFVFRRILVETYGSTSGGIIAGIVSAVQIQILNIIYGWVAHRLNDFENHRTQTEYEDNLIAKTFLFKFVNSYNSLFYIAFFKRYDTSVERCQPGNGCMSQLQQQLGTIYISMIVIGNATQLIKPYVKKWFAQQKDIKHGYSNIKTPAELELELAPYDSPFDDFDSMAVQFGYVTLFVIAFPITPLLALFNNFWDSRVDSTKLCKLSRRPFPSGAQDIGTWYMILNITGFIAVITNIALVVFETDLGSNWGTIDVQFIIFIFVEHAIFLLKLIVGQVIPDEERWVTEHKERQQYLVDVLINSKVILWLQPLPKPLLHTNIRHLLRWETNECASHLFLFFHIANIYSHLHANLTCSSDSKQKSQKKKKNQKTNKKSCIFLKVHATKHTQNTQTQNT